MSRGHGKWERAILAALDQAPAFYLTDLLPTPHTRSHVVALNRAPRDLPCRTDHHSLFKPVGD
jgi:hypothetical protein